jgi:hypothetical protein
LCSIHRDGIKKPKTKKRKEEKAEVIIVEPDQAFSEIRIREKSN